MNVSKIGSYTILQNDKFKQVYSPNKRMMQIGKDKVFYVDTSKMKTIKVANKIIKWI